jgi:hypothetical protein
LKDAEEGKMAVTHYDYLFGNPDSYSLDHGGTDRFTVDKSVNLILLTILFLLLSLLAIAQYQIPVSLDHPLNSFYGTASSKVLAEQEQEAQITSKFK